MNGILNVLKPAGMTSFDVIGYLRKILKIKKIGHTGTLDPAAVGVLPICIGKATKAIEFLMDKDKIYRAELTLGISTDTQDSTGETISIKDVSVTREQIINATNSFCGKYLQLPPMYSAIKVNGRKLYDLARAGLEVERKEREVEIHFINILSIRNNRVIFDVGCSKGTYIRTLCSDIGEKLGCGGHMSFLVRTKAGQFSLEDSLTLEEITAFSVEKVLDKRVLGIEKVFDDLSDIILEPADEKRLVNGLSVKLEGIMDDSLSSVRVYGENNRFLALGDIIPYNGGYFLKSRKLFV
ncbi:MAG: tRNA pseudouridine(55) synthase TruB [Clostridiaceae bacterium]|nr:tRNA pseudouridine(55) synthase TruB [Clostridiaceae bacterium]